MLAYLFIAIAVLWRVAPQSIFPYPMNFTPVLAALLFFGSRATLRQAWFPVGLLAASDIYLNRRYGYSFPLDMLLTWAWYAAMVLLGRRLQHEPNVRRIAGLALAGSVSFFVLSNFGVWLVWHMYPMTLAGLAACYANAVPFYRNQFAADLIFTAAMFGIPMVVNSWAHSPASRDQAPAA